MCHCCCFTCCCCCCAKSPMKTINISLIVLISINLFISLITTANRAGNTAQYKDSLQILKELEEGHYSRYENDYDYDNYYNENDYDYDNYYDENKYYPRDYYNHDINNVSLFKSWKNVELVLNLLRFILLLFQFMIIFYLLSKRLKNLDLPEKSLPRAIILSIGSMILSIIQLIYSIIITILILLTMDTIEGMRSYSDVTSTDFNTRSYFNIFLNIKIIVLFSIFISFSYRIYYNGIYNKGKNDYVESKTNQPNLNPSQNKNVIIMPQNGQYPYPQPIIPGQNVGDLIYQGNYNQNKPNEKGTSDISDNENTQNNDNYVIYSQEKIIQE